MAIPTVFFFFFFFFFLLLLHPPFSTADHVLYTDEILIAGQNLSNGPHRLSLHQNCRLVLSTAGDPTWSTNTSYNGGNCYLVLTQKGELVVRRNTHYTLWSSAAKSRKGKYALVLDDRGRLAVYGQRRWSTSNPKALAGPDDPAEILPAAECVLHSGHRLTPGEKLRYRQYELAFSRCNAVINDTRTGRWLWQTGTKAAAPAKCHLQLENSGELSLSNGWQRIWSSNKRTDSGRHVAILRFDGRLAVYGPLVWANVRMDDSMVPDSVEAQSSRFRWAD
ncbi:Mannose-specific lectin 3 [Apostasia shenzhenica]|uniref:Mannose-specific lectin 3 n=1 Tax=Apostasia shenzhenica TaxID=1088818 RepID=A0A2H9ZZA0_9ASPA|nr:Mannose-specific lectin 3 [Apostasia shenzhenica]